MSRGLTNSDPRTIGHDARVAEFDNHGPQWPTQHVTVLLQRITELAGENPLGARDADDFIFIFIFYRST